MTNRSSKDQIVSQQMAGRTQVEVSFGNFFRDVPEALGIGVVGILSLHVIGGLKCEA
jgi:hypothetical protein